MSEHYDRDYFDKWYRHPKHRVKSAAELRRQVAFVLRLAEWVLDRPVRSVLDVGCGEGHWRAPLRELRPSLAYDGVDPSAYAIERYGAQRNLQQGGIVDLDRLSLRGSYDLVVCCGMLNYLPADTFAHGVAQVARRTAGLAYLEIFTDADAYEGDTAWPTPKSAAWYRRTIRSAGLSAVGMHGYVPHANRSRISSLELGAP